MTSGRFFGEPLKEAGGEKGFTLGIGPGLPILGSDDPADVNLVFGDEVAETAQIAPSGTPRLSPPEREGGGSGVDCIVQVVDGGF
ncbi:hypothetical protein VD0002_g7839 [Verticillium dahliae]|uniref:Uncharacterized protein n=1 Tax=Verticillium dahliae TaxID=27337 RepID=A0AA44W9V9_VERDA|nr:hypothetical protein BJF96_g9258 [Verticillium dahliae]PNH51688.1 hypothetical protein VD0003_g5578 [Verticillium dahliae]PNH59722.1 hypothetical protein VD0002_g7839 [Verticillium dahliae]